MHEGPEKPPIDGAEEPSSGTAQLVLLLRATSKTELEKICANIIIDQADLANLVLAGTVGALGAYLYANHFADLVPAELEPKDEELEALARNGIGKAEGKAAKAVGRMAQLFRQRGPGTHLWWATAQVWRCLPAHVGD